jgi:hypothetical protein
VPKPKSSKKPRRVAKPLVKERRKKRHVLLVSLLKIGIVTALLWSIVGAAYY